MTTTVRFIMFFIVCFVEGFVYAVSTVLAPIVILGTGWLFNYDLIHQAEAVRHTMSYDQGFIRGWAWIGIFTAFCASVLIDRRKK